MSPILKWHFRDSSDVGKKKRWPDVKRCLKIRAKNVLGCLDVSPRIFTCSWIVSDKDGCVIKLLRFFFLMAKSFVIRLERASSEVVFAFLAPGSNLLFQERCL